MALYSNNYTFDAPNFAILRGDILGLQTVTGIILWTDNGTATPAAQQGHINWYAKTGQLIIRTDQDLSAVLVATQAYLSGLTPYTPPAQTNADIFLNDLGIPGGGGEVNTASNVGSGGVGLFKQKTGVDLEFKNINKGSNKITVTDDGANNEVDIDVDESNVDHNSLNNTHNLTTDIDHDSITNTHNLTTDIDHDQLTNTHNLTTDIDHDQLTNTHNLTTDIDHDQLTNYFVSQHRVINDSGTSTNELWSASKIDNEISNIATGIGTRLLEAVQDITALKALNTTSATDYPDKCLINVEDNGLYRLDRDSTATESIDRIVQPTVGVGRWFKMSASINDHNNLSNLQGGAVGQYNHLSNTDYTDLTDGNDSTLHYHATDRNRSNHTGTQTAATISDFDTEVSNNTDVSANTTHRGLTNNPHVVTKTQVGLSSVTNDAQLKRSANDWTTFSEKVTPHADDWILIEDSENVFNKKKVKKSSLSGSGSYTVGAGETFTIAEGAIFNLLGGWHLGSPIQVTYGVNQNNLVISNLKERTYIRINATVNIDITGIVMPAPQVTQLIIIAIVGTGDVHFKKEDINSSPANRFQMDNDTNCHPEDCVMFLYDTIDSRWRLISTGIL